MSFFFLIEKKEMGKELPNTEPIYTQYITLIKNINKTKISILTLMSHFYFYFQNKNINK
jgi:hypothetical protein